VDGSNAVHTFVTISHRYNGKNLLQTFNTFHSRLLRHYAQIQPLFFVQYFSRKGIDIFKDMCYNIGTVRETETLLNTNQMRADTR
jgi:hypothetical protein